MKQKGLELASRFALPPNSLGYCGKETAPAKFIKCAISGECIGVKKELEKFIVLNPYLETLEKITGLPKFSNLNVEAYWMGNKELKKTKNEDYLILMKYFTKRGVPEWLTGELMIKKPKKFIPTHLFQVLHVGVGKASGSVPYNMETINNCAIRAGKVLKIDDRRLILDVGFLKIEKEKYSMDNRREEFNYRKDFVGGVKVGDVVAVHWKQVVKKLTQREERNLLFWTKEVLATVQP